MATTLSQQKAIAIAPKFTAALSVIGSYLIIHLILFPNGIGAKNGGRATTRPMLAPSRTSTGTSTKPSLKVSSSKKQTYQRLILGMSLCDLIASIAWFFTTWPIPAGTPGVFGAVGNEQTCEAQAFFAQFSLSTVMYNASLAIYYYLVIVKGWKGKELLKVEKILHLNAMLWGLGTAIAALPLTLFNQVGWDCWISAHPLGCQESWNSPDGTTTCTRGDNGSLYQWAFYYAPLWFVIVMVSVFMFLVYQRVKEQEKRMERYKPKVNVDSSDVRDSQHEENNHMDRQQRRGSLASSVQSSVYMNLKKSILGLGSTTNNSSSIDKKRTELAQKVSYYKQIQTQATYYVGAFLASWFFPTIFQVVIVTSGKFPFPLLFLTAFFVPSQGVMNLIVFLRPKYLNYRVDHLDEWRLVSWFTALYLELRPQLKQKHRETQQQLKQQRRMESRRTNASSTAANRVRMSPKNNNNKNGGQPGSDLHKSHDDVKVSFLDEQAPSISIPTSIHAYDSPSLAGAHSDIEDRESYLLDEVVDSEDPTKNHGDLNGNDDNGDEKSIHSNHSNRSNDSSDDSIDEEFESLARLDTSDREQKRVSYQSNERTSGSGRGSVLNRMTLFVTRQLSNSGDFQNSQSSQN